MQDLVKSLSALVLMKSQQNVRNQLPVALAYACGRNELYNLALATASVILQTAICVNLYPLVYSIMKAKVILKLLKTDSR